MRNGLLFTIIIILVAPCLADTLIVDLTGNGDYLTIQSAVDAAQDGDTISVRDGIYTGEGNRDIDYKGKTIIVQSESGPENCIVDCQGTEQEPHRGFKFITGENSKSVLMGVTITKGYAPEEPLWWDSGGAIYCTDASPTIKNCIITNNNAILHGGGIFAFNSDIQIIDCAIINNLVIRNGWGGGIYCHSGNPQIIRCKIYNNSAKSGGGVSCSENGSQTRIEKCHIRYNVARSERQSIWGGGGILSDLSSPTISQCLIENNAGSTGGGIKIHRAHSDVLIDNCIIQNNEAFEPFWGGGGGIMAECFGCTTTITNSLVTGNTANLEYSRGGGIYASSGNFVISNCTLSGNSAYIGGGMNFFNAETLIENCILWDNNVAEDGKEISFLKRTIEIQYSTIEGGEDGIFPVTEEDIYFWGNGNIDDNPLFVNSYEKDFRLSDNSPCIDAGDPNFIPLDDETDLDGNERMMGFAIDMGCYEFLSPIEAEVILTPKSLNRKSNRPHVIGKLTLMGFSEQDIDPNEPMVLFPGDIEAERIEILPSKEGADSITLKGYFDNAMLMDGIEENGDIELTVATKLFSGQWVCGIDTVKVK